MAGYLKYSSIGFWTVYQTQEMLQLLEYSNFEEKQNPFLLMADLLMDEAVVTVSAVIGTLERKKNSF